MLNLNTLDKEDALAIIKELFAEMCSSRLQLKPILSEILKDIDNNLFIDADSDEVKDLLEQILHLQDSLSQVDDLKKAVSTRRLSTIDEAISDIDRNRVVTELKLVLSKFKTLVCSSDDDNEIDAAKKLKRQAHKLSIKADKMNADRFAEEGIKFINVAEKIEDPSKLTSASFVELQENFPENRFLAYSIMKRSLHFDTDDTADDSNDNRETASEENNLHQTETTPQDVSKNEDQERLKALVEEYSVPINDLMIDNAEVDIETKNLKKKMSVKSLNNKLHEFADGSESFAYPILRTFCKSRVFSTDPAFEKYQQEDKARQLVPVIVDKLHNWGIVDKVRWQGLQFYYLSDQGKELLTRALSIKEIKNALGKSETPRNRLITYLRRFILFSTIWALKVKNSSNKLDADINRYWVRSISKLPKNSPHVLLSFSLLFFGQDCQRIHQRSQGRGGQWQGTQGHIPCEYLECRSNPPLD